MDRKSFLENATNFAANYIPQAKTASTAIRITWWVCVFALVIALILIIVSFYSYVKGSTSTGTGLLITGGVIGAISSFGIWYTNRGFGGIAVARFQNSPVGKLALGQGETFDGETVQDVQDEGGCGCSGGKDEKSTENEGYEEFNEDINELDYIESSDEEAENPPDHEQNVMENKKSKKKHIAFESDKINHSLEKILSSLKNSNNSLIKFAKNIKEEKDLSKNLDYVIDELGSLNTAYKNLDISEKEKVDKLLDKFESKDDEVKLKLEMIRDRIRF